MKKLLLAIVAFLMIGAIQSQQCSDLLISEYVEGGGNNKALEIYNASDSPILLSDYKVCRYSNGEVIPACVELQDIMLNPDSVHVAVLDKQDPNGTGYDTMIDPALQALADSFYCPVYNVNETFYWNGNDAVSLEKLDGTLVDLMGEVGVDPGLSWTMDSAANYTDALGGRWWTRNHTLVRKPWITEGVTSNPSPFIVANQWDSLPYNTFDHLGWHDCACHGWTGIETYETSSNSMFVYPNPVSDHKVMLKATANITHVSIMDMTGRIVYNREVSNQAAIRIQNLNLEQGMYLLNARLEDGAQLTEKIYVQ
ncbi:MAG: T9SS type A sorting domain-containing protein [Bacteroidales bacterium]